MSVIKLLPEFLINQIAAGEVVERPASVVKELVENSLDAGATHITIEVQDGGDNFLRITDDGSGMDREDALMAFERHATSKISQSEDLFQIRSLGFRGEAIASIASVSFISLQTKKRGELEGTLVIASGGKIAKTSPAGVPEGTQIEVKQLFFNTPARKKYLKNPLTEYNHIFNTVTGLALAFPHVAFKLVRDSTTVFDVPIQENFLNRIRTLMGNGIADELIPVFYGHSQIRLEGFIGKPILARSHRNNQYLFVNQREVKSHVLSYAVKESYHSLLPKEKYPVFFLYFQINPELVDVNVHPRKLEVRFRDEKEIFLLSGQACRKALENHVLAPDVSLGDADSNYYQERKQTPLVMQDMAMESYQGGNHRVGDHGLHGVAVGIGVQKALAASPVTVQAALDFTKEFSKDFSARKEQEEIRPLAQLENSWILCAQGKNLVIVDQHAAHERIRYSEILEDFERSEKPLQTLLTPLSIEFSGQERLAFEANREIIASLGFELEAFGGNTFSLRAIPAYLANENLQQTVCGLLDDLTSQNQTNDFQRGKERSIIFMACRSAVKFGDKLSPEQQQALVKKLMQLALPYTCPHGRPTMITLNHEELKKRFGREYR